MYLIKLGGSLITDKSRPMRLRPQAIDQIAKEIAKNYKKLDFEIWIIGNGAGSFGHYMVHKTNYLAKPGDKKAIASVRQSVAELNGYVVKALLANGVPAQSLPPSQFMRQTKTGLICDTKRLEQLLKARRVPVIYGDVIDDETDGSRIISTEEALNTIAQELTKGPALSVKALIFATAVDGVLDENGQTISRLSKTHGLRIKSAGGYDVTGGMAQKAAAGFEALAFTKNVYIINGNKTGELSKAINLKSVGTKLVK